MKIVLDTNVIVSGLLNPHGTPGEIVRMLVNGKIGLSYDARIFKEYEDVIRRPKFKIDFSMAKAVLESIESDGELVIASPLPFAIKDPGDRMFLEVALAAKVDFLVTGNGKDFLSTTKHPVRILSPKEFRWEYF